MTPNNRIEAAFPVRMGSLENQYLCSPGLSKRELFAAMAMQGLLSNERIAGLSAPQTAEAAVRCADALLAAMEKHDD